MFLKVEIVLNVCLKEKEVQLCDTVIVINSAVVRSSDHSAISP